LFPDAEQATRNLAPRKALGTLKQQVKHAVHIDYTQRELYLMSRVMPYQPLGPRTPPAGDAEVAKMMAKLAQRSAGNAPASVTPQKEPLKWQNPKKTGAHGQGYMLSECGQFSVTKDMHELGFSYSGWDIRPKMRGAIVATHLGVCRTKEEAIALCEAVR